MTNNNNNNNNMSNNYCENYWDLEKELEEKFGSEKLTAALVQLEEDYGTNGLDSYRSGNFELLLNIIEDM
jgi:hypothetical protein